MVGGSEKVKHRISKKISPPLLIQLFEMCFCTFLKTDFCTSTISIVHLLHLLQFFFFFFFQDLEDQKRTKYKINGTATTAILLIDNFRTSGEIMDIDK